MVWLTLCLSTVWNTTMKCYAGGRWAMLFPRRCRQRSRTVHSPPLSISMIRITFIFCRGREGGGLVEKAHKTGLPRGGSLTEGCYGFQKLLSKNFERKTRQVYTRLRPSWTWRAKSFQDEWVFFFFFWGGMGYFWVFKKVLDKFHWIKWIICLCYATDFVTIDVSSFAIFLFSFTLSLLDVLSFTHLPSSKGCTNGSLLSCA